MATRLFLAGDVMTGRGIDQILRRPSSPGIHETYVDDARTYVRLAEDANGPIPRNVEPSYIWGDALAALEHLAPQVRIVNLETAVTTSGNWQAKGINYRMNPANVDCLTAAHIDCCVLANNHVLDWGTAGLVETLNALRAAGMRTSGAGCNEAEAQAPATLPLPDRDRVLVFGFAHESSGAPPAWAAAAKAPGIGYLDDLSSRTVERIGARIARERQPGDLVIASVHWGSNWGYAVSEEEQRFAHGLVEHAGVDVFHGHSSHHPKSMEVFRGKLILYGCGDLLNDYEGIGGYEKYGAGLGAMYLADLRSGTLEALTLIPMRVRKLRLSRASHEDARWLAETLNRESRFPARLELAGERDIKLRF